MFGRNGLQDIKVGDNDYIDIEPIKCKPIDEWFEASDGRDGWEGLVTEIYEKLGDNQAELVWEIWGSEDLKAEFCKCLEKYNIPIYEEREQSSEEKKAEFWKKAEICDHKGLYMEAFKLYKNLADNYNMPEAQCKVAEYYYKRYIDIDEKESKEKAFLYYEKAAGQENTEAEFRTGQCWFFGEGVNKNAEKAFIWYKKAAEKGHSFAQNNLGSLYFKGDGIIKDEKKAEMWWLKSAEQGYEIAQANLGALYRNTNTEKSFYWTKMAAEQGRADQQFNLGLYYCKGTGTPVDKEKATKWFKAAAEQGHARAQYRMGMACESGDGIEKNIVDAVNWYLRAAEQDNVKAQYKVGYIYLYGVGIEKDEVKAVKYLTRAAEKEHIDAEFELGNCYENGWGVEKDLNESKKWYISAADAGHEGAKEILLHNGDGVVNYCEDIYDKAKENHENVKQLLKNLEILGIEKEK